MQSLVEIGLVVLEKNIFFNLSMCYCYFVMISPSKRTWPFFWTNPISRQQKMHCLNVVWNFPSGSKEEDLRLRQRRRQRQRRRTMQKFWSETLTGAIGSDALKRTVFLIESITNKQKYKYIAKNQKQKQKQKQNKVGTKHL